VIEVDCPLYLWGRSMPTIGDEAWRSFTALQYPVRTALCMKLSGTWGIRGLAPLAEPMIQYRDHVTNEVAKTRDITWG
jgi:hypothetical protein